MAKKSTKTATAEVTIAIPEITTYTESPRAKALAKAAKELPTTRRKNLVELTTAAVEVTTAAVEVEDPRTWEDLIPDVDELNDVDTTDAATTTKKRGGKAKKASVEKPFYKNGRWVKTFLPKAALPDAADRQANVMYIGTSDNQFFAASVKYTANTATFSKAVYWALRYLGHAQANDVANSLRAGLERQAADHDRYFKPLSAAAKKLQGNRLLRYYNGKAQCSIERLGTGIFNVILSWTI